MANVGPGAAHLRDERAQTAVLISGIRWAGIALAAFETLLAEPHPSSVPAALAVTALMVLYNVPATLARRLPAGWVESVLGAGLAGDFLCVSAFVLLSANDPQDLTFVVFFLVAVEAAVLYRWRAVVPFSLGAAAVIVAAWWERAAVYHIPSDPGSLVLRAAMVVLAAVFLGQISETSERRRAEALRQSARNEALHIVASRLGQTLKQDYVLDTVVDSLARLYHERWHGILLRNPAGALELKHVRGTPEQMEFVIRNPQAYEAGPIRFGDIRSDERVGRMRDSLPPELFERYAACIAIPLRAQDLLFGILVTLDPKPGAFSEEDVSFLEALGGHAAAAVANARLYEEVEMLSLTDATTALFNRRAFDLRLRDEVERAGRYGTPLSLLMIDVDHFKLYNDMHGHPAGDKVLRKLGEVLAGSALRATDIASRFGGEEFAVILPLSDLDAATVTAQRLRAEVEATAFPDGQDQPLGRVSVSIGIASYPAHASTPLELVERADLALYEAKRLGRNRVVAYRAGDPSLL